MRIDNRPLAENQAAESGQTSNLQELKRPGASWLHEAGSGSGADRVELSDLTGALARALSSAASERASRMEHLGREVERGSYQVDSRTLSRAIVAEMQAAGHNETPRT